MREEHSAAELARLTDQDVGRVHYLLGQFVDAGIAEVTAVVPRAGRAVKRYRVPRDWYVPFELSDAEHVEALAAAQLVPRMHRFVSNAARHLLLGERRWGVYVRLEASGGVSVTLTDEHGLSLRSERAPLVTWTELDLTGEEAARLHEELAALLRRYERAEGQPAGARRPYSLGVFLAEGGLHE